MKTHSFSVVGSVIEFVAPSWWTAPASLVAGACGARLRRVAAIPFSSARWWLLLLLTGGLLTGRGEAATISWTNTAGGLWSTAANWSPNQSPAAADTVRITNSGTYTVVLDVTATVAGFTLGASSGSSTQTFVVNGFTFTLNGTGSVTTKGQFNFEGGTLDGVGTNTVSGVFNWTAGMMDGQTTAGLLVIAAGGRLNIDSGNNHDLPNWRLNNAGTVAWAGGSVRGSGGTVLNNSGLWHAQSDDMINADYGPGLIFNNGGTFRKSVGMGTTRFQSGVAFNNSGTVDAQTGVLDLNTGGTSTGVFVANTNAVVSFNAGHVFQGTNAFNGAGRVQLEGGDFSGTNTFTGALDWNGGRLSGPGQTTIGAGATLTIAGGSLHDLPGWRLVNAGTVLWTGGQIRGDHATVIQNIGLWLAQSDNEINAAYSGFGMVFNNAGTFRKTPGTGTTTIQPGMAFNNTGLVDVLTGRVLIAGNGANTGTYNAAAGTTISINGDCSFGGTNTFTGTGLFRLADGTVTLNGTVNSSNFELAGATLKGTNTLTGAVTWTAGPLVGPGQTTIASGATLTIASGSLHDLPGWRLINAGTVLWTGGQIRGDGVSVIQNNGLWDAQSNDEMNAAYTGFGMVFNNTGTFLKSLGIGTNTLQFGVAFNNTGVVDAQTGGLDFRSSGTSTGVFAANTNAVVSFNAGHIFQGTNAFNGAGRVQLAGGDFSGTNTVTGVLTWNGGRFVGPAVTTLAPGATLQLTNAVDYDLLGLNFTNAGTVLWLRGTLRTDADTRIQNAGLWQALGDNEINAAFSPGAVFNNAGTLRKSGGPGMTTLQAGILFTNRGLVEILSGELVANLPYVQTAGSTVLSGGNLTSTQPIDLQGGSLGGVGSVNAWVANNGQVNPGLSPGRLTVVGDYVQTTNGVLHIELAGLDAGTNHDQLTVTGQATLAGTLDVTLAGTYRPSATNRYTVVNAATVTGTFATNNLPTTRATWRVNYPADAVVLEVLNAAPQLTPIANVTMSELTSLSITNVATDSDRPAQTLTFSLVSPPPGVTIEAATGVLSWTPSESQGPGTNTITVRVSDSATPSLLDDQTFTVTVSEVNVAPVLTVPANQTINELTTLTVTNLATDSDLPVNPLVFAVVSAPAGVVLNATNGVLTWTPTEAQGPSTNTVTIKVTDTNGIAVNATSLSVTSSFTIIVNEVNVAPVLAAQANRTINELTTLLVTNTATDADLPANTLTYSLIVSPAGMTINTASGVITWTPTEAQGPSTNTVTTKVRDNGVPSLSATNTFLVVVNEVNVEPVLPVQTNRTINELVTLTVTNTATDADLPANSLTYSLLVSPAGMAINSASGVISWTPTEGQGPSTNTVTSKVSDNGVPSLSATNSFLVVVTEANTAPVLTTSTNRTVNPGETVTFTNTATDADTPANTLTFSLLSGPVGATVNPGTGQFTWRPSITNANTTNTIQVRVTDNGSPALSDTRSFTITVQSLTPVTLTPLGFSGSNFRVNISGPVGPDYTLQTRGSLTPGQPWVSLTTTNPLATPFQLDVIGARTIPTNRFFRILLGP